jgi:hypothetical protein
VARRQLVALITLPIFLGAGCGRFLGAEPVPEAPATDSGADAETADATDSDAGTGDGSAMECDPDKPFGAPVPLPVINTPSQETVASLSLDELTIYFTRYAPSFLNPDIYVATRANRSAAWSDPAIVAAVSTSATDDIQASLSPDGLSLYFSRLVGPTWRVLVSKRATPDAGFDAPTDLYFGAATNYQAPFATSGELWLTLQDAPSTTTPTRIATGPLDGGASVAVDNIAAPPYSDYGAVLSVDGKTLYFSSFRPPSSSSSDDDIWVARRASPNGQFGSPTRVDELSTTYREVAGWLSPDGCRFYFGSNRLGTFDIFIAERGR